MATALRIARLNTRLQLPADGGEEGLDPAWLRDLSQRALPAALNGVAERVLSRAGLAPEALVAVRRLDLRLSLAEAADEGALLQAWPQALEQALLREIAAVQPATGSQEGAVVFADAWAAEQAHLGQVLTHGQPAWWAERLLDGRGERLDLAPAAILRRWLERQPARAVALLARLAELPAPVLSLVELLPEPEARQISQSMAERMSQRPGAPFALLEPGTPLRALLASSLERLRVHPQLGSGASASATGLAPWRLAVLLHQQPSLALLSPPTLLALAERLGVQRGPAGPDLPADPKQPRADRHPDPDRCEDQRDTSADAQPGPLNLPFSELRHPDPSGSPAGESEQPAEIAWPDVNPASRPSSSARSAVPPVADAQAAEPSATAATTTSQPANAPADDRARHSAWIHAGGLLLLLNRPDRASADGSEATPEPTDLGDVALLALQRLLAPLGPGERAVALQRERPLLALLAPDRTWPDLLQEATLQNSAAAARQLEALIAAIPASIRFAPGALRQVYGPHQGAAPPLPDRQGHQLAALLWRPGLLEWDGWEISLRWPLASVDGALRRQGWDLDPGWQPALRRLVRFHYDAALEANPEERP